jgi:hypothetical protein
MKPQDIELFVERLCGYFPTATIGRNTVKAAWGREEILLDCPDDIAKQALQKLQTGDNFPTLHQVKSIIGKLQGKQAMYSNCRWCSGNGWVDAEPIKWLSKTYRAVKRCECVGGERIEEFLELPIVQEDNSVAC